MSYALRHRVMRKRGERTYPVVLGVLAAVAMVISAQPAIAVPGELDFSFGSGGVLSTDFGGTYDWAYAAAIQGSITERKSRSWAFR